MRYMCCGFICTVANNVLMQKVHHINMRNTTFFFHQRITMCDLATARTAWKCNKEEKEISGHENREAKWWPQVKRKLLGIQLVFLPSTNITGTEGGSNLTLPAFGTAIPTADVFDVPDRLSPPRPFHSASSESGAVEFASEMKKKSEANKNTADEMVSQETTGNQETWAN